MTCPAHRPRPVGPPKRQPSGFVDTVLRCEACGEVSVRTTWGEGKAEAQQLELPLDSQEKV